MDSNNPQQGQELIEPQMPVPKGDSADGMYIQGVTDKQAAEAEGKIKFGDRTVVEIDILKAQGKIVTLMGSWLGKREIQVPRWNIETLLMLGDDTAQLIADVFPNDLFFLYQIDTHQPATAAYEIADILFRKMSVRMLNIVYTTLEVVGDDEQKKFRRSLAPSDLLEIWVTIMEQEINNETMEALQKKVRRILADRFALQNVWPSFAEFMDGAMNMSTNGSPSTS